MAAARLNFDESQLDTESALYGLYSKLYNGMVAANQVDAPDYVTNPPLTDDGEIDQEAISEGLAGYSTILMKNSAYLYAEAITTLLGGGEGGGGGIGFVSRSGDQMSGELQALRGFQAGEGGNVIFRVNRTTDAKLEAIINGLLKLNGDLDLRSTDSINFGGEKAIYEDDGKIHISNLAIDGTIQIDELAIGDVFINEDGVFYDEIEYYHPKNCNNSQTDWAMDDAHVYGNLDVDGEIDAGGRLVAKNGFDLGENDVVLLQSVYDEDTDERPSLKLESDLSIVGGYGIKFSDKYIIKVRTGANSVVSFSAPGRVLNLGDSDEDTATIRIALQSDIYNSASTYRMVSRYGDGNFPNSFSAGCGNAGSTVMQTYYGSSTNMGVVFPERIRLGSASGPYVEEDSGKLVLGLSYQYVDDETGNHLVSIPISLKHIQTTSLFRDQSLDWSASALLDTDDEFFVFGKPVEASAFSIQSEQYKTRLIENALFFNDGVWLEGITDGILFHGDAVFSDDLSSTSFASGFAGYGWGIKESGLTGNWEATFDNLVVRKKMRVYEMEVQKTSSTNGSLWVSDSCSGDTVTEILN